EFWIAVEAFYDKEEHLIYRDLRYINEKSGNGAKLFWGRGNGWVTGALCRVLSYLPEDYPDRRKYEDLLRKMLERLVTLQNEKGFWNTSLLDWEYYPDPETSATGFFTYSLWWAINNGILPEGTYLPYAEKGWSALVSSVHENGMLGYVQPIGGSPDDHITGDKNEVYGTAAFMLSGLEILKYLSRK
ncbi:MAG: glycoside hydrolase family 88 protein, partial [Tannerella sp.]|nr:glycoside hydrolase family 88 protein [Tannerella sp.]